MEESSDANGSDMEDRAVLPLPTTDNIRPSGLAPTAGTRARVRQLPYRAEIQQKRHAHDFTIRCLEKVRFPVAWNE